MESIVKLYIRNVLVGIDQLFNAVFGGDPDETMSSRVCRYKDSNWMANLVYRFLNWIEPRHCEESLEPPEHHTKDILK